MLSLTRVCVPLTLDCNLKCKYCYRNAGTRDIPDFTEDMLSYLENLSPNETEAVIASGGEPLLYFDKVKQLFEKVPKEIHKKIMSNASELTEEILEYINENEIELSISHDGAMSTFLTGYDNLLDPEVAPLLRKVKKLHISGVCTKYNPNPWENYQDTLKKFNQERTFNYFPVLLFEDEILKEVSEGFDYDEYFKGYWKCKVNNVLRPYWLYKSLRKKISENINVLPNGEVVGMTKIHHTYGTIHNSIEEILENKRKLGDYDKCKGCSREGSCNIPSQLASPNYCNTLIKVNDLNLMFWENRHVLYRS